MFCIFYNIKEGVGRCVHRQKRLRACEQPSLLARKGKLGRDRLGQGRARQDCPWGPWRWPPHWPLCPSYRLEAQQECLGLAALLPTAVPVLFLRLGEPLRSHRKSQAASSLGHPGRVPKNVGKDILVPTNPPTPRETLFPAAHRSSTF